MLMRRRRPIGLHPAEITASSRREASVTGTTSTTASGPTAGLGRISLRTLVSIRWVAIAGQALAILTVHYGLGFHLPLLPAFAVVAGSALLNVVLIFARRVATRLGERYAAMYLGYDILQLAILLYLTGGLQNPFSILILAPVTVAATALGRRPVVVLSIFAIAAISGLTEWHLPLPWHGVPPVFPIELAVGIWIALVLATVFIAGLYLERGAGGAAAGRRGGGHPAGAGARAAGLGGRRARRGGGARARQSARHDRRRRHRAGAGSARRQPLCRGCRAAAEPVGALPANPRRARRGSPSRTAARPIRGCRSRRSSRPPVRFPRTREPG